MSYRKQHTQEVAAAKAGMSQRSARRLERDGRLPSQKPRHYWRSRSDPFAAVWELEIVPLLQSTPRLMAITILRKLQEEHPGCFSEGVLRTLQRRIRHWRALAGPEKEIFFPQEHAPGERGLSDFTAMGDLHVTI